MTKHEAENVIHAIEHAMSHLDTEEWENHWIEKETIISEALDAKSQLQYIISTYIWSLVDKPTGYSEAVKKYIEGE